MSDQSIAPDEKVEWIESARFQGYRGSSDGRVETKWRIGKFRGGVNPGRDPHYQTDEWIPVHAYPHGRGGYLMFSVVAKASPKGKRWLIPVHSFICELFHGPRPNGKEVAHFPDREITNNRSDNLSWKTRKENSDDRYIHGTNPEGSRNPRAVATENDVVILRQMKLSGLSTVRIVRKMKSERLSPSIIKRILRGETWSHVKV